MSRRGSWCATKLNVSVNLQSTVELPAGTEPTPSLVRRLAVVAFLDMLKSGRFDVKWEVSAPDEPKPILRVREQLNAMRDRFPEGLQSLGYDELRKTLTYTLDIEVDEPGKRDEDGKEMKMEFCGEYEVGGVSLQQAEDEVRYFGVRLEVT